MPSLFDITALHSRVTAKGGNASVVFTVHSNAAAAIRVQLMPRGHGATQTAWLAVPGDVETTLAAGETRQVMVNIALPAATPLGDYPFSLLVCAVNDPEEMFTAGPVVAIEHAVAQNVPPKPFRWLPWAIAAACLITGAAITFAVMRKKEPENPVAPAPAPPVETEARFDVFIIDVDPDRKISVIKALREIVNGIGLAEAKALVEGAFPKIIRAGVIKAEAEKIAELLKSAGAKVVIKAAR